MQPFKTNNFKVFSTFFPLVLVLVITIPLLAACSKDPVERANYAEFLKTDIEAGLRETVKWFLDKENLKKYKADIYNV